MAGRPGRLSSGGLWVELRARVGRRTTLAWTGSAVAVRRVAERQHGGVRLVDSLELVVGVSGRGERRRAVGEPEVAENPGDDTRVARTGQLERFSMFGRGSDQCPLVPEDPDGFDDDNGCPDNDGDGIPDDRLPSRPDEVVADAAPAPRIPPEHLLANQVRDVAPGGLSTDSGHAHAGANAASATQRPAR